MTTGADNCPTRPKSRQPRPKRKNVKPCRPRYVRYQRPPRGRNPRAGWQRLESAPTTSLLENWRHYRISVRPAVVLRRLRGLGPLPSPFRTS
uniref:Uncharacterized protein n=1 Tax=Rhizobium meliloti TaxID=382 RepID=A0A0D4DD07_RHIML|nr:hypothetical protein [Sinorhizobium meliloti]